MVHDAQDRTIEDLIKIVARLRDPQTGCPWDKVQTHHSIRKNLLEEAYEVADAIDLEDAALLQEELGDVLLQIVFHAQIENEKGVFSFDDVCKGICEKLILRHPHIFAQEKADTQEQVLKNWDAIKRIEKQRETLQDDLKDVPAALPALMRAQKLQKRALHHGVGIAQEKQAFACLQDSMKALEQANDSQKEALLGQVLFAVAGYARFLDLDAEQALEHANNAFISAALRQE